MAALIGAIVGIPSLRIKGLYLAIATLAGQLIIEWIINHTPAISGGAQASIQVPRPTLFGHQLQDAGAALFLPAVLRRAGHRGDANLVRSRIGRAFVAIRDQDIAAEIIGINIFRYKLLRSPSRRSMPACAACSTPTISASPTTSSSRSACRSTIWP